LFAGLGAGALPLSDDEEPDDEELDDWAFFGDGAGELPPSDPPPPGPAPGPEAAGARFHWSGREAGRGEVGCAETWAVSRTEGDTAESATAATGGVKPGPANIAQATTIAPTPGAPDRSTTRGTARSRGRLLDGTDTTHPHVGQVRTRPRRKIKKTGRHHLAERGGRSGRARATPCCSTARGSSAPRPDPIGNRGATHAVASPKRQALRYVRSGAHRSPASATGD
jgi:hypothetical protein